MSLYPEYPDPSRSDVIEARKGALEFANSVRQSLGFPPVKTLYKGSHSSVSCPITNTIYDDDVDPGKIYISTWPDRVTIRKLGKGGKLGNGGSHEERTLSEAARKFVTWFDERKAFKHYYKKQAFKRAPQNNDF